MDFLFVFFMHWIAVVGHLNLSAVFVHRVFKSKLIGLKKNILVQKYHRAFVQNFRVNFYKNLGTL